jgi:hypothetical protein
MTLRAAIATSLCAVAAVAAAVVAPARASSAHPENAAHHPPSAGQAGLTSHAGNRAGERPCGAATDGTYLSTALAVARKISAGESNSAEVSRALATIEDDQVLANAVSTADLAVVRSEVLRLVYNGEHIVRLRVLRSGQVLDDLGGPLVLAPVSGSLRVDGRVVGTFVMSVQDDAGYQKLVGRLVGADTVMRYQGQTILSNITVAGEPLPDHGTVAVGSMDYLVASFAVPRFPAGELSISLLVAQPQAALVSQTCAQVSAGVLSGIAQRIYGEAITSPWWVGGPLAALARTTTLAAAVAAGDDSGAKQIVQSLVAEGGFAALRVSADGHVVANVGDSTPLLAPVTRPLVDGAGQIVGQAIFAVETAQGYTNLAHSFLGLPVLVRAGSRQIAGTLAGPAKLPSSGSITYEGVRYAVASFPAVEFPSTQARVYVLNPTH